MAKLTRAQRERIIIASLKGQDTPGYEVIHNDDDTYTVKENTASGLNLEEVKPEPEWVKSEDDTVESSDNDETVEQSTESDVDPLEVSIAEPRSRLKNRTRQNARLLLQQLSELMNSSSDETSSEDDAEQQRQPEFYQPSYIPVVQTYHRRRLKF